MPNTCPSVWGSSCLHCIKVNQWSDLIKAFEVKKKKIKTITTEVFLQGRTDVVPVPFTNASILARRIWNPQLSLGPPNRGWGLCSWINSHKESGSRLLSRSTAKGPSHQKLMSYLDHAVSSAPDCKNTAGRGRTEPQWWCVCFVCLL